MNYVNASSEAATSTAQRVCLIADSSLTVKRLYDVTFSLFGLALLSPLFLLIAALIKITDRGSVFYRQRRVGLGGLPFLILKFRTMVPQADRTGALVTSDGDARITKIGRILRKT